MDVEKKTADMKAYQKAYKASHKGEANNYMKEYIKKAEDITCKDCGGKYKSYCKYKHEVTQKHLKALIKSKEADAVPLEVINLADIKAPEEIFTVEELKAAAKEIEKEMKKSNKGHIKAPAEPYKNPLESVKEYGNSDSESEDDESVSDDESEEVSFKLPDTKIDSEKVVEFLTEHFAKSAKPTRSAECKTPRNNKNKSTWNKVSKLLEGKSWAYLGKNFMKIVKEAYDKPSTQADTVVMLKLVMSQFATLSEPDKIKLNDLNRSLKETHISKQTSLPDNAVTYEEMKAKESDDNTTLALMMRLYNADMPSLRIYDWINSYVGKTDTMNEINLKKGVMIRRIVKHAKIDKKNKVKDEIIQLPASLVDFIKKRGIKGDLFGTHSGHSLNLILKKAFPDRHINSQYFRHLYSTTVTPKMEKGELKTTLETMNHSAKVHASHYRKSKNGDALLQLVVGK